MTLILVNYALRFLNYFRIQITNTTALQPISKYSEEELVALLRDRNQSAFSYLYDNYAAALYGVIFRMVEDTPLAEDILQDAFIKIWNNFTQYDHTKGRLFTWMMNITRNLTIDTLRSKGYKKQKKISQDENSVTDYRDRSLNEARFDTIGLRKQLQYLKPDQKIIIDLAYFNGYTQEEISKELNIPLGTVKTRMRTAIFELRKLLQFN
jgi:RNA polymerase sigma factor (sigma-70 family)